VSHPDGLPDLFLDRSLGRIKVPNLLRHAGLRLITLAEHYGIPADEGIADETWLEHAGQAGLIVFMKDEKIRLRQAEREAVVGHGVQCFCLSNQNLDGQEMADRFLHNLDRIQAACVADPGPFIYAVDRRGIRRLDLDFEIDHRNH